MDIAKLEKLRNTFEIRAWVVGWAFLSAAAVGAIFGNVFKLFDPETNANTQFNVAAMFGGIVVGFIATIPVFAVIKLLDRQLQLQYEVHVAPLTAEQTRPVV